MPAAEFVNDGDLARDVRELKRQMRMLMSGRALGASAVEGDLRVLGGNSITVEGGDVEARQGGSFIARDGGGLDILDAGRQFVQGGKITAIDNTGDLVFEVNAGDEPSIFLRQDLIRDLSLAIFADRIHSGNEITLGQRSSMDYGDPTTGAPGPTLTDVAVSAAGTAIVFLSAQATATSDNITGLNAVGGYMGVEISGASPTQITSDSENISVSVLSQSPGGTGVVITMSPARIIPVAGLNEGLHTFRAVFRSNSPDTPAYFANRSMAVIAL